MNATANLTAARSVRADTGERHARMGELAVSDRDGGPLVIVGLGSCVGVALVDCAAGVASLAHVVLAHSRGGERADARFADRAVPALLDAALAAGADRSRLRAVIAGGAEMFKVRTSLAVGANNAAAVRRELARADIPVVAEVTGGTVGRTMRVYPATGAVTVRQAGGLPVTVLGACG